MNFSILSDCRKKWQDILVIGKSTEPDGRKYHILGMTLSDEERINAWTETQKIWKCPGIRGIIAS